jgi:hypothetical protein
MERVAAWPDARLDDNAVRPWPLGRQFDGRMTVLLRCGTRCRTIRVDDDVQVAGEKVNEQFFYADEVTVTR